jgi:hypothetical protein
VNSAKDEPKARTREVLAKSETKTSDSKRTKSELEATAKSRESDEESGDTSEARRQTEPRALSEGLVICIDLSHSHIGKGNFYNPLCRRHPNAWRSPVW